MEGFLALHAPQSVYTLRTEPQNWAYDKQQRINSGRLLGSGGSTSTTSKTILAGVKPVPVISKPAVEKPKTTVNINTTPPATPSKKVYNTPIETNTPPQHIPAFKRLFDAIGKKKT
jgi:hypothetical protein